MVSFILRHKKVRGVITVFFTIIYLFVYLMIGVFVDGGRVKMASTVLEDAQQIATENIMSQYNRGLYEYYGLFGLSDYSVEDISKDVQKQIEETMNMKVPESAVKSFILDTVNGAKSAIENVDTLNSDGSILENATEYAKTIQSDIRDSNKRFNPYGFKLKEDGVNVSYIDLSNVDALRSQIRDNMRYEALMLPAVSFFDTVNKLMEVSNGINTVRNITQKTGSESDVKKSYKKYNDKLKEFSKSLKELFKKTYDVNWKQIDSLVYETEKKPEKKSSGSIIDWFKGLFGGNDSGSLDESINDASSVMQYSQIETSFKVNDADDDDKTGLKKSLNDNVGKLNDFCDVFDDENGWPEGMKLDRRTEDGEVTYYYGIRSLHEHQEKIRIEANERIKSYIKKTWGENSDGSDGELYSIVMNTKNEIDETINAINTYLDEIASLTKGFEEECSKVKDKESISIYGNSIEKYLRQWNDSANQRKVLEEIQEKLNSLVTEYNWTEVQMNVSEAIEKVVSEAEEGEWHPTTTLLSIRSKWIEDFHERMLDLVDSINKYQAQAEGETQSADVFQLIDSLTKHNDEDKKEFEKGLNACGKIEEHKNSDNIVFNYAEYLESQSADEINNLLNSFTDGDMKDFKDDGKLEDKVNGIFTKAQEMVSNLMKAMFDNIYDETYILTNCRDYVHTSKYVNDNDKERIDNDTTRETDAIFNDKFVKDKSATKYLTNEEFKNIEVTPAEIEYILWGDTDTKVSVIKMYTTIFMLRFVLNYIAALTSAQAQAEATALGAVPFVGPVLSIAAPIVYALAQSGIEVNSIMNDCKKENVWNGDPKLSLFSPIFRIADAKITDLKDTLVEKVEKVQKIGTRQLIDEVRANNNPENTNITTSVNKLEEIIEKGYYKEFIPEEFTKDKVDKAADEAIKNAENKLKGTIAANVPESISENIGNEGGTDFTFKAGYTDYLLIMLFINGIDKKTQMSRLQDIIETNMKKAQSNDFSLANTFSQISVETNSTIKYIFMSQSLMKRSFSLSDEEYNEFPITIKTAFAY